jgi:drug/metabolite transporter (DMT)-like permease
VLNPIWVFLFLGERPSGWAIIGGAIIIASVIVHMLLEAKAKRDSRSPLSLSNELPL